MKFGICISSSYKPEFCSGREGGCQCLHQGQPRREMHHSMAAASSPSPPITADDSALQLQHLGHHRPQLRLALPNTVEPPPSIQPPASLLPSPPLRTSSSPLRTPSPPLRKLRIHIHLDRPLRLQLLEPRLLLQLLHPPLFEIRHLPPSSAPHPITYPQSLRQETTYPLPSTIPLKPRALHPARLPRRLVLLERVDNVVGVQARKVGVPRLPAALAFGAGRRDGAGADGVGALVGRGGGAA